MRHHSIERQVILPWTHEDEATLRGLSARNMALPEIARFLGRGPVEVSERANDLGLAMPGDRHSAAA